MLSGGHNVTVVDLTIRRQHQPCRAPAVAGAVAVSKATNRPSTSSGVSLEELISLALQRAGDRRIDQPSPRTYGGRGACSAGVAHAPQSPTRHPRPAPSSALRILLREAPLTEEDARACQTRNSTP